MSQNIVSFAKPPVIERVLGVQFEPIAITSGHLGRFWTQLGDQWTDTDDAPRLPDQFENFGKRDSVGLPSIRFETLTSVPTNRLRIRSMLGDRMLQVQDTRFLFNWIRKGKDGDYPRFPEILSEFDRWLASFREFVGIANLGQIESNQWEVTYVNHIPAGDLWKEPTEWSKVIPGLLFKIGSFGGTQFERMSGEWHSEEPNQQVRLHTQVQDRTRENEKLLALTLTARGPTHEGENLRNKLQLGHDTIVRAFDEMTSPLAHKAWGKESNGAST